jgi:hypothetical protein
MIQQGDVIIDEIKRIPEGALAVDHKILAEGEVTGHLHAVTEGDVQLFEKAGILYMKVNSETATITHNEHKPVTVPKGIYTNRKVREYDIFTEQEREVRD